MENKRGGKVVLTLVLLLIGILLLAATYLTLGLVGHLPKKLTPPEFVIAAVGISIAAAIWLKVLLVPPKLPDQ